jgi:hypothetical protein
MITPHMAHVANDRKRAGMDNQRFLLAIVLPVDSQKFWFSTSHFSRLVGITKVLLVVD